MAVGKVTLRFFDGNNGYVDDLGEEKSLSSNFGIPDNMVDASNEQLESIGNAAGAVVKSIKGEIIQDLPDPICPEKGLKPRRIKYSFADGLSLSVPFFFVDSFVDTVNGITSAVDDATEGRIACIQLIGEEHQDVGRRFEAFEFDGSTVSEGIASSKISRQFQYTSDLDLQQRLFVIMNTDEAGEFPSPIRDEIETCLGDIFDTKISCGTNTITTRRLVPQYLVEGEPNFVASHEVPVKSLADVSSCAESLVDTLAPAIICLPYYGESDSRLHTKQGINLPQN
jgi:hypothetical protein